MKKLRKLTRGFAALLLGASITLAGCAGGGSSIPHTAQVASKGKAQATFTIRWPQHVVAASVTRAGSKPQYISPSALAVVVEVNANAATPGPITFANANGASTSTVTINAPVGQDDFIFTLWDTAQTAGETQPVGNQLGQAEVSQNIVSGQLNTVNATIGGITSHIGIAPAANQSNVETDAATGYNVLVGDSPATFTATAYDADNNVIIPPGAPTLSFAPSGGSTGYLDVEPVNGNANQFTVATLAAKDSVDPYGIVATATDSGVQHTATSNYSLLVRSAIYVSYGAGSGSLIAEYDSQGNSMLLASGAFSGLTTPAGMAYDGKAHRLFVTDTAAGKIFAFDGSGNAISGFTPISLAGAQNVAYDPKSDVLYATGSTQTISFKPDGSANTLAAGSFSQTASPDAVAYVGVDQNSSPDDEVALGNDATGSIDYYHPDGTFIRTDGPLASPLTAPIKGMVWDGVQGLYYPVLLAGGTSTAGYESAEDIFGGFAWSTVTSTSTRYAGMAFSSTNVVVNGNPSQYELFVVQPDANQIQGYLFELDDFPSYNTAPDVLITTPSSSGLSQPNGIAIAV